MPDQLSLLDPPVAQVRRSDPRTAKRAAALNPGGRATQAARILRRLWTTGGTITADECWRDLAHYGEDVTRGEWSARLGVLCSPKRGLLEPAGEVEDLDRHNHPRLVLSYRLTEAGRAECARMFGRVA